MDAGSQIEIDALKHVRAVGVFAVAPGQIPNGAQLGGQR
jgi:hypothetical protein